MRVIICGTAAESHIDTEIAVLREGLPEAEVSFACTETKADLLRGVKGADALIVSFAEIDAQVLAEADKLKCIAVSASGFGNIDVEEATRRGIAVCPIGEYCTQEVADHTLTLMLALLRQLKHYSADIDVRRVWDFESAGVCRRIGDLTLAIFGLGKIGHAVAKRAQAFGMRVIAYDPYADKALAEKAGVQLVDEKTALREADVITNHMRQTDENVDFFCRERFLQCEKHPVFLNMGRGAAVKEEDLCQALDEGLFVGAGLDVLKSESPDLSKTPLTNRENVIITPHAAFYSDRSLEAIKIIPCQNIIHFFRGEYTAINTIVNRSVIDTGSVKNESN